MLFEYQRGVYSHKTSYMYTLLVRWYSAFTKVQGGGGQRRFDPCTSFCYQQHVKRDLNNSLQLDIQQSLTLAHIQQAMSHKLDAC